MSRRVEFSLRALNKQENNGTIATADNCIRDLTEVVMKSMAHMQKIQHIAVKEGASTARGFQEGKLSFSLTENDAKEEKKKAEAEEERAGVTTVMRSVISPGIAPEKGSSKSKVGKRKKKSSESSSSDSN